MRKTYQSRIAYKTKFCAITLRRTITSLDRLPARGVDKCDKGPLCPFHRLLLHNLVAHKTFLANNIKHKSCVLPAWWRFPPKTASFTFYEGGGTISRTKDIWAFHNFTLTLTRHCGLLRVNMVLAAKKEKSLVCHWPSNKSEVSQYNTTCITSIWTSIQVQVVCKVEHDKKILRSYIASVMRLALCKDFTLLTVEDIVRSKRGRPCNIATLCASSVQLRERVWYCNPCEPANLKWASTVK